MKHVPSRALKDAAVYLAWAARPVSSLSAGASAQKQPTTKTHGEPQGAASAAGALQPLPNLPPEDLIDFDNESRMRLAVALDVICTATRKIAPGPTVLTQAVRAWLSLRGRSQEAEVLKALVAQAREPQAIARARISRGLSLAAAGRAAHGAQTSKPAGLEAVCTPESVMLASRATEAAGESVVHEAILWIESQQRVAYRRG